MARSIYYPSTSTIHPPSPSLFTTLTATAISFHCHRIRIDWFGLVLLITIRILSTMGDETTTDTVVGIDTAAAGANKRKATSTAPPDGYVCRLCSNPGHWIQVCPTKKTGTKNNSSSEGSAKRQRKSSDHVPVPGQDPSPEDIAEAKELQKIPPPKCTSSPYATFSVDICSNQ